MSIIISSLLFLLFWLFVCCLLLYFRYRNDIVRLIREPVLKHPVVIFESDDWGPGPLEQEQALLQINQLLSGFQDQNGNHPVMTLGLILAEPDAEKIAAADFSQYFKRTLLDIRYQALLTAIQSGQQQGVLSLHLHGLEHYWPSSIMLGAAENENIKQWLTGNKQLMTEDLPSHMQSRWVNSVTLPSSHHNSDDIDQAITEEIKLYQQIFKIKPTTVVPPTFVWTDTVESAYAKHDFKTFITPGRQCDGRDSNGHPAANGRTFYNGEIKNDLLFLVRNDYFEPALGHKAEKTLHNIKDKTACGRPALLEMHRFNFISGATKNAQSLNELERLLKMINDHFTDIRFLSAEQLSELYRNYHQGIESDYIIRTPIKRIRFIFARIKQFFEFNRYAKYSGINFVLKLI